MSSGSGYLRFPHVVGNLLTFTAEDDLWLATIDSPRASRLTSDGAVVSRPRLSADGQQVAWVSRRQGEPEVFLMPTDGGLPRQLTWFGSPTTMVLGWLPDGRLAVASAAAQPFRSRSWAYAIDVSEGADATPQLLPYGPVNALAMGPATVVGTGYTRDPAHWKRYRGGTAGRLWIDRGTGEFAEFAAGIVGGKMSPTWVGDRLAFLSDHEGHGNVYSLTADGTDLRRHTDHSDFYARQLAGDGERLVYQSAGRLFLLDSLAADSQPRELLVTLSSTRAGRAPFRVDPGESIGTVSVDHSGRASVVEVRGSAFWLTHRAGPARAVASASGVRHRLPVAVGADDTPSIAYVSDASGEDSIEIASASGDVRSFGAGQVGRVLELVSSPDGTLLALTTHDGRLLTLSTASGDLREIERNADGDFSGPVFSPDSRWLAYGADARPQRRQIKLVEVASGVITEVTPVRFVDSSPAFSPDGKYLYFLSARTFDPVYDEHVFDLSFPLATRPYLVTLAATTPSPFDPELKGHGDGPHDEKSGDKGGDKSPDKSADTDSDVETEKAKVPEVVIDLDGLAQRVVAFPVAAGRLESLHAVKGGVIWTDSPVAGVLGESREPEADIRPSLQRWDLAKRKQIELAARVDDVAVSGDGTKLVIRDHGALKVVPSDHKPADDDDSVVDVDLSRITLEVDPPAEWRQMVAETGRLMRDHFWVEDMGGLDWQAAWSKHLPTIDRVATRDDLSDVLWEVNGETGASHAYEMPPAPKQNPLLRPAFLGADLTRDSDGRWVVTRVLPGDNSARDARSPLTAPGVDVRTGDVLLAVNGVPVGSAGVAPMLLGTANKPVELRVARGGDERSVVVVPLGSDAELRYLDWVASRRMLVHEATAGRVGYVHVPDMMSTGWAAFHRDLRAEMDRDALIVDTRDNGGGHTSQLVIEKLSRRIIGYDVARYAQDSSYPESAPHGPLVSVANEWAGSDGDIVNAAFKALGLGPVIGTRTWGGVVGIDGRYSLVDGTGVTQPRYSFWFEKFGWAVENHGVDPDHVVEFPPHAWGAGEDPQLAAAIAHITAELAARPAPAKPDVATRPSLAVPALPPRP
jgi:tricorn protease